MSYDVSLKHPDGRTCEMPEKIEKTRTTQPYDKGVSIDVDPTGRLMLVCGDSKVEVRPLDIFEKAANKHVTFRVGVVSYERTLTADVINKLLDEAAEAIDLERV